MPRAFNSLSSGNKFAKRRYEAIAQAMQHAHVIGTLLGAINGKACAMSWPTCSPETTACLSVIGSCTLASPVRMCGQGMKGRAND
jgi:hypothetical protein